MSIFVTSSNDIRFVSKEMAGVMYSPEYYYPMPVSDTPLLMNIDLKQLYQKQKEDFNPAT